MKTKELAKVTNLLICEDIREEKDQKLTYVGVYSGNKMLLESIPTLLPKLFMQFTIDIRETIPSHFHFELRRPNDVVYRQLSFEIPSFEIPKTPTNKHRTLEIRLLFAPFEITEMGRYRIMASLNKRLKEIGSLEVAKKEAPAAPRSKS